METQVFDNEGNFVRTVSDQAAVLSAQIVSVNADSPDDITVTWIGANDYFGGENTQYGQHQIILEGGALQPDTFVNHAPIVADLDFSLSPGQSLEDVTSAALPEMVVAGDKDAATALTCVGCGTAPAV